MFLGNSNFRHCVNYKGVKLSMLTSGRHTGGAEVQLHVLFLNVGARWSGVYHAPATLLPGKNPSTLCTGGRGGRYSRLGRFR
jgi:hypothetical protein